MSGTGRIPGFILALLLGATGGALFTWIGMPLSWMLGSMTACGIASIMSLPVRGSTLARPPMSAVIGTMLGSQFGPHTLESAAMWWPALLALAAYLAVAAVLCNVYLRRVIHLDRRTAFFSAMPGGLVDMVLLGAEKGGDERTIALMHSSRIFLVVLSLPPLMTLITGADPGARVATWRPLSDMGSADVFWFIATLGAGIGLGKLLRLPAPYLIGPMLVSAGLHWTGASGFVVPSTVMAVAQVVLGTVVGCRFAGTAPKRILHILMTSAGATAILLSVAVIFAFALHRIIEVPVEGILLAFAPGGLAEMSLVALALNLEVAFVVVSHISRIGMVILAAGLLASRD
ncbi:AbrB family transcriptional regulator [Nitratireductor sp. B36]|jgi:membrane AbrB-like protein|uniref:AbrB family transcriptional regulator n=1 Tax=Nitratireductor sp. B36 TaxID=2762059 RepID=UPI001E33FA42|nr:AbrB family transcriptional regulator [Nitratireductor sp. B36]MCC5780614.1 AbrB family transcriptional regulator [Nitratireductor sp. B36]